MFHTMKIFASATAIGMMAFGAAQAADWPTGPVEIIVPYGAGGGTDATARMMAKVFQDQLGQPFNVVNKTGGGGIIGLEALVNSPADGSTIGLVSADLSTFKWFGQTELTYRDIEMIGIYNLGFPTLMVQADSQFEDAAAAFEAMKADPAGHSLHIGSSVGNSYHISFVGIAAALGINPAAIATVTGTGAASGLQELAAGAVDFSLAGLNEGSALMEAGKVEPLVLLGQVEDAMMPELATAGEALDVDWQFGVWRGVAAPKGVDAETMAQIKAAFNEMYATEEFQSMMREAGFATYTVSDDELVDFVDSSERAAGEALKSIGVVK